jgi:hypothetical protein
MNKLPLFASLGVLLAVLILPSVIQAGATINSVSLNGNTTGQIQVDPGDNITVILTTTLTDGEKWKGTNWGINNFGITSTCVNSKNAKEGTRNIQNGVYTETFTIKAPAQPGVYDANFQIDGKNNCGTPVGAVHKALQRIRVGNDAEPPVIAAHSDIFVVTTSPQTVSYATPVAIDNIDSIVPVTCSPVSGTVFPVGETLVTCTATDSSGNAAVPSTFKVTLAPPVPTDTIAPVIAAHENISVVGTGSGATVTYTNPTATDDVDASVIVTCTPTSGSTFALGNTTVTCTASDVAGNAATPVTFTVTVALPPDTVAPVIGPSGDISILGGLSGIPVIYANPTATDNVDASVAVTCLPASGTTFAVGTTTVTCTASDASGNAATPTTFNVAVYLPPPSLIYQHWPSENGGSGAGLITVNTLNSFSSNSLIVVNATTSTQVHSVCLAVDSYEATDTNLKLGVYSMSDASHTVALLGYSDIYPFAGQYVDWYFAGQETCFNFPTPITLTAGSYYAIGVDRFLNSSNTQDILWYNRANVSDPDLWMATSVSLPAGETINSPHKPYIKLYGIQ